MGPDLPDPLSYSIALPGARETHGTGSHRLCGLRQSWGMKWKIKPTLVSTAPHLKLHVKFSQKKGALLSVWTHKNCLFKAFLVTKNWFATQNVCLFWFLLHFMLSSYCLPLSPSNSVPRCMHVPVANVLRNISPLTEPAWKFTPSRWRGKRQPLLLFSPHRCLLSNSVSTSCFWLGGEKLAEGGILTLI